MTESGQYSILIADDHTLYVDALVIALHQQSILPIKVVGTAVNGEDLLLKMPDLSPDIILLDLNMPVMNGLEVIPLLKADYPAIHIIIVTNYSDPKFVRECLQLHKVSGYILKTSTLEELINGLEEVCSGQIHISKNLQLYPREIADEVQSSQFDEAFVIRYHLTRRELEILGLISQAKTSSEIAENLFISPQTVGAHRKNIMRKLNITTTAGLVRFAIQNQMG
ncbi:MAG: response regulator transcription factor [Saprospiraceae bacterium]